MKVWTQDEEARRLAERFVGVNQAAFARQHMVPGGASMLSQHIKGRRPLNLPAATAYAAGFGVPLEEISPRLALEVAATQGLTATEQKTDFLPGFERLSVPLLANSGSMGPGSDSLHEEVMTGSLPVSPEWAKRVLKPTSLQNLRFIHGYGDSMKGTFEDGDILLVDIGVQEPKIDGVYVLEANDRVYIKRVRQRLDGQYEISSDNPKVRTVDVLDGTAQVECRGRVLWAWNGVKL